MKNRQLSLIFIVIIFAFCGFLACTTDSWSRETSTGFEQDAINNSTTNRTSPSADTLYVEIMDAGYTITFTGNSVEDSITSNLKVTKNSQTIIDIPYTFNVNEEHWRLKQAPKIIQKANSIQNVDASSIVDVQGILDKSVEYIYVETIDIKNPYLVSILNYYNSILNTRIRANSENSDCGCLVNPEFILDKTFFNCQEDQFYNVSELKDVIIDYSVTNSLDGSTTNLLNFLNNTQIQKINFETYYNFYTSTEDFNTFISNTILNGGGCSSWCPLGCGSDHGCCGNYSGCCIYWNIHCYVHDKMCINCKPAWFCLPGCKPDKPVKQVLSLSIY